MGKSIVAVIVGFIVWTVLWLGGNAGLGAVFTDAVNEQGRIVSQNYLIAAVVWSVVCSVIGGVVCRSIKRGGRSVLVLAGLLLLVGLGVEIGGWDLAPAWYHAVFLVLLVPGTLVGGKLAPGKNAGGDATSARAT